MDYSDNLAHSVGFGVYHGEYFWRMDSPSVAHSVGSDCHSIGARTEGFIEFYWRIKKYVTRKQEHSSNALADAGVLKWVINITPAK